MVTGHHPRGNSRGEQIDDSIRRVDLLRDLADRSDSETREMFLLWVRWEGSRPTRLARPAQTRGNPAPLID
jgi:hypothetical protein